MKTVIGAFEAYDDANSAILELERLGYNREDISVIARDYVVQEWERTSGTAEGAAGGAVVGGLAGLLVGIGAIALPAIGPVVAVGTLATMLASTAVGAGVGATAGGLIGALVDLGIAENEATMYAEHVKKGGVLVGVNAANASQREEITQTLQNHGAVNITSRAAAVQPV